MRANWRCLVRSGSMPPLFLQKACEGGAEVVVFQILALYVFGVEACRLKTDIAVF
jgi:hypothetical protein